MIIRILIHVLFSPIHGKLNYIIPACSIFYECENFTGRNVDPELYADPEESKQHPYQSGSSMFEKITIVLASGIDFKRHKIKNHGSLQEIIPVQT